MFSKKIVLIANFVYDIVAKSRSDNFSSEKPKKTGFI